jgi:serine protease Do
MNKRLLYLALIIATLTVGVVIGTIVSGGVKATGELQKSAALVIPDPVSLSNAFSQIAATIDPSVVNINTEATMENVRGGRGGIPNGAQPADPFDFFDFFGGPGVPDSPDRNFTQRGTGTGFIVDKAGYILTNHHVVDKATKILVRLDDKSEHQAKLIGSDTETDLAVIKIDVGHDLPVAKLGNSDAVKVGDWVLAIGSPFSLDHTVTAGIISAKGRENIGGNNAFQSFLQTDAAINPGNSGGPLVSMNSEVIGINTAIISENRQYAGLGFALPSNIAVKVYNQLVQSGKVTRGSIGITYVSEQDPALMRAMGLKPGAGIIVQDVIAGGPAAKAGVRPGDVITEIEGTKISSSSVLLDVVANTPVGRSINVKVNRDGREQTIPIVISDRQVVIGERAARAPDNNNDQGDDTSQTSLGIRVQAITPDMVRQLRLDNADGVMITSVEPSGLGEEAGFQRGMIITRVIAGSQRIDIKGVDDFRRAERLFKPGTDVAFMVLLRDANGNQNSQRFLGLTIP